MNRKFPKRRPFFTVRGFIFIGAAVLMALVIGYCAATMFGGIP